MAPLRCLISGAGIAGSTAAFWLARAGHTVTILERASSLRKEGQTIDICDEAEEIVSRMGLLQECKNRHTGEDKVLFVDQRNRTWANFPFRKDGEGFSPLNEIEMVRGELAELLWDSVKDKVRSRFGTTIKAIQHGEESSTVTLSDGSQEIYDVVIVAEGLYSRTRALAFDQDIAAPLRSLGVYNIIYSIPRIASDDMAVRFVTWPGRKAAIIRADKSDRLFVGLMIRDPDSELADLVDSRAPVDEIKAATLKQFEDARWDGWLDRILDGLKSATDVYPAVVGQSINKSWSIGQTVLVGDCAYAPSLYTGGGTHCAIIGAYQLAADLHNAWCDGSGVQSALRKYESEFKPVMEDRQNGVPGWAPKVQLPDSTLGVFAFHAAAATVAFIAELATWPSVKRVFTIVGRLRPSRGQQEPEIKLAPLETFDRRP